MVKNKIEILSEEDLYKKIDAGTEIVVVAPWNGNPIPVTIRMLNSAELSYCGEFNTVAAILEDHEAQEDKKILIDDIIETKNIHERIIKLALVHPTFNELEAHLKKKDFFKQKQELIEETKVMIEQLDSAVEKEKYLDELTMLELSLAFLIPEDFTTYLVTILLQREATDLNKLTKETLLHIGFLAEKYNKRPSEYIEGIFTEKQKIDIDTTALMLVHDFRKEEEIKNKTNMRWIRGHKPRKKRA